MREYRSEGGAIVRFVHSRMEVEEPTGRVAIVRLDRYSPEDVEAHIQKCGLIPRAVLMLMEEALTVPDGPESA